ncbi:ABC transporter ATP-binding protein [Pseudorhodoferax sp.]|uniref:ABC transporter ATP-binding protein n=1 Tax=Pseudorhodoferax sp. TaxID=1993553 RepID=UPI002DD6B57D|nr:ABC transporter ATP-binding protein [Pseudorhodoferax sp.]
MSPSPALFSLRGVVKRYQRGDETVSIFEGLDMDIQDGDFLAMMGPSGSGKSTLLNLLGGIDRPDAGSILFRGQPLQALSEARMSGWRAANAAFVFQHFNLLPMLSVARNVELPLMLTTLPGAKRRQRVGAALELVGLSAQATRLPSQLSGGQQQRVAIARAIVADTVMILCDEPTGNLDRQTSDEVLNILSLLNRELGKTIVMVTHDARAAAVAARCLRLDKGRFLPAHAAGPVHGTADEPVPA